MLESSNPGVLTELRRSIGAATDTKNIEQMMKNPYAVLWQVVGSFAIQVWVQDQIKEILRTIEHALISAKERIEANDKSTTGKIDVVDLLTSEQHAAVLLQERLDKETQALNTLFTQRDGLLKPIVKEWQDQQTRHTEQLFADIAPLLKDKHYTFTDKDKEIIANVSKGQQIQIVHPELIPAEINPKQVIEKANMNTEINLMRILCAKDEGLNDPDNMQNLSPSKVRALRKLLGGTLKTHFNQCKKEDEKLAEQQDPVIQQLKNIAQKIEVQKAIIENLTSQPEQRHVLRPGK